MARKPESRKSVEKSGKPVVTRTTVKDLISGHAEVKGGVKVNTSKGCPV